jgi:hypothetical protein
LIARGFRDERGALLPIFFEATGGRTQPDLAVYLHALTVGLFGRSVEVARATTAVVSVLAVASVALTLKWIFRARFWWSGALLMAVTPAWFLQSRTAHETTVMVSFYACFILCYLLYRCRSARYLLAALPFGAGAFYAYVNGQALMPAAGLLLLLSDLRYHLRHWRIGLVALAVGILVALPTVAFRLEHPGGMEEYLRARNSYWSRSIPLEEKLAQFGQTYAHGLSPRYWFVPNEEDGARYRMKGYGHIRVEMLPLVLVGLAACLVRLRSSPHRAVLLVALPTILGAAFVDVNILRVLAFVVPAAILAGLGLEALLSWLTRHLPYRALAVATFILLSSMNVAMLRDALEAGPLWFREYGWDGVQYGSKQLFVETIPRYLQRDPAAEVMVTPTWANAADVIRRFLVPAEDQARVKMRMVDSYLVEQEDLGPHVVLVMTHREYERARASPKFKQVEVEEVLPYPDGSPGFYVARLAYADDVDAIFAAERRARGRLVEDVVELGGERVRIRHSAFEEGQPRDLFDGDAGTLVRIREDNPSTIEIVFPQPRPVTGLAADLGVMDFTLTVDLLAEPGARPVSYETTRRNVVTDPHVELTFDRGPATVSTMRLRLRHRGADALLEMYFRDGDPGAGELARARIRELTLR